uniref:Uncharacterized protein n=1 Tax=Electrophorus electricus TaxID=8005 RepID=A0A4W4FAV3_ELEEL
MVADQLCANGWIQHLRGCDEALADLQPSRPALHAAVPETSLFPLLQICQLVKQSYICDAASPPPPDFELRESGVSAGILGVWSRRKVEPGEEFGPHRGTPSDGDRGLLSAEGWEVGANVQKKSCPAFSLPCLQVIGPASECVVKRARKGS